MTKTDADEAGKLFIGGLSWETSKEILERYFGKFGEIVDCVVMKNNETGRSRGFGFITFKDPNCIPMVLQAGPHELNGKKVDPKQCTPRAMQKSKRSPNQGKIFLGGLPIDITENEIRQSLSAYGKVTDVIIMYDPEKKKPRGFGFVSFESDDTTEQVCAQRYVNIKGKQVECKKAENRDPRRSFSAPNNFSGNQRSYNNNMNQNWQQANTMGSANPTAAYQSNWSSLMQQPYSGQPGVAYGSYPNWNAASNAYSSYDTAAAGQYNQSSYQGYVATPNYAYAQASTAATTPTANSYGTSANYTYPQNSNGSATAAPNSYGSSGGTSNYGPQGDSHGNRGQGYHPYRR